MDLGPESVIMVVKPLYGIPESGLHRYLEYFHHHEYTLGMILTTVYPCVLSLLDNNGRLDGVIALQVYDYLFFGSTNFLKD